MDDILGVDIINEIVVYLHNADMRAFMNVCRFTRQLLIVSDLWKNKNGKLYTSYHNDKLTKVVIDGSRLAIRDQLKLNIIYDDRYGVICKVAMIDIYLDKLKYKYDRPGYMCARVSDFMTLTVISSVLDRSAINWFTYFKLMEFCTKTGIHNIHNVELMQYMEISNGRI